MLNVKIPETMRINFNKLYSIVYLPNRNFLRLQSDISLHPKDISFFQDDLSFYVACVSLNN